MSRAIPLLAAAAAAACVLPIPGLPDEIVLAAGFSLPRAALLAVLMAIFGIWGMLTRTPRASKPTTKPDDV